MLVRKVGIQGKHKLADKWESEVYTIRSIPNPDIPVFRVKSQSGKKFKTLHRNMLLPFNAIPSENIGLPAAPVLKRKSRSQDACRLCAEDSSDDDRSEDSSESDSDSSSSEIKTTRVLRSSRNPETSLSSIRQTEISNIETNTNHEFSSFQNSSVPEPTGTLNRTIIDNEIDETTRSSGRVDDTTVEQSTRLSNRNSRVFPRRTARVRKPPDRYGDWTR